MFNLQQMDTCCICTGMYFKIAFLFYKICMYPLLQQIWYKFVKPVAKYPRTCHLPMQTREAVQL